MIILTTGGTGGHLFPAQAVASSLIKKEKVAFVTDRRGHHFSGILEKMPVYQVCAKPIQGRRIYHRILPTICLGVGILQAVFLLLKLKPKMVIGFGGYASMPTIIAAHFLHIPVALHEQNSILGKANRLLAPRSKWIATSFKNTQRVPVGVKTFYVGMPVRENIFKGQKQKEKDGINLLVMGGSQGAKVFSTLVPDALNLLPAELRCQISLYQQVRSEDLEKVNQLYEKSNLKNITLKPFFTDIQDILINSDFVISRSGASSLAEFEALKIPAILIPLPTSADNHQYQNAVEFCKKEVGWLLSEKELTPEKLAVELEKVFKDKAVVKSENRKVKLKSDAAEKMADLILKECKNENIGK